MPEGVCPPKTYRSARAGGSPVLAAVLALLLAAGCGDSSGTSPAAGGGPVEPGSPAPRGQAELFVFAASSLLEVFQEIGAQFEQQHPGTKVRFNFAGSAQLVAQLSQGASASVAAFADTRNMRQAQQQGLIAGEPVIFARNRLVLIVPASNPAGIHTLADLARPGVKVVLAHDNVPIGHYARQVLERASQDPAYGSDFAQRVLANLVSEEVNVKQVVAKIQLGEADAALVYATDVTPAVRQQVTEIELPEQVNVVTCYPIAVVVGAPDQALARAFIDQVRSPEGQAVLERYGFRPVGQEAVSLEACE
jgi:molybdate transport system substrate-binding protein